MEFPANSLRATSPGGAGLADSLDAGVEVLGMGAQSTTVGLSCPERDAPCRTVAAHGHNAFPGLNGEVLAPRPATSLSSCPPRGLAGHVLEARYRARPICARRRKSASAVVSELGYPAHMVAQRKRQGAQGFRDSTSASWASRF